MKTAARRARRAGGARRPGGGVGAPARQLHDQPLQPDRGLRAARLRALRPRHGGDPDLPGRADRRRRRTRGGSPPARSSRSTGSRRALVPLAHGARPSARRGRAADDAARGAPRRAARSHGASLVRLPRRRTTRTGSAGRRSSSAQRRRAAATSCAPTRRTCSRARSTRPPSGPTLAPTQGRRRRRRSTAAARSRRPTASPTPASPA